MPFTKKIAAFDLDGTLTESKQQLTPEMAGLLVRLAEKTNVAIISGGSFRQYEKQFLPFWNQYAIEHHVHNSGTLVLLPASGSQRYEYDSTTETWKISAQESFLPEVKNKVIDALNAVIASSESYDIPAHPTGQYIEERGTQITFSALGQEAPIEEKIKWDPDMKKRKKIQAELSTYLPEVDVTIGGTTSIDVLPKGFNKAEGLKHLLSRLDLHISDMVFVGDAVFPGGNDYAPFEAGIETIKVAGPKETANLIAGWLLS